MSSKNRNEVRVGEKLPELAIDVTTTVIVAGAIATQDFTPVHHDKAAARSSGLNDIIMNTMTTNGFVGRYITDWAGPDARIRKISLKLGAPNYPGDTMKMKGSVKSVDTSTGSVEVEVSGGNRWGEHVAATVMVELPEGA